MASAGVVGRPAPVSSSASTRLDTGSVSTSTPSQSKITPPVTGGTLSARR
jgi:hypothetical protein